jgi:hypothetical protein
VRRLLAAIRVRERIGRHLERTGKLVRDQASSYLALESQREGVGEDALTDLQAIPFAI